MKSENKSKTKGSELPDENNSANNETKPQEEEEEEEEGEEPKDHEGLSLKGDAKATKHQHDILSENGVTISVNYSGGGQGLKKRMYHIFLLASRKLTAGHLSYSGRGLEHREPTKGSPAVPFPGSQATGSHACRSHEIHFTEELLGIKGDGSVQTTT